MTEASISLDDDHETWCLLCSGVESSEISSAVQRFSDDYSDSSTSEFWQFLVESSSSLTASSFQQTNAKMSTLSNPLVILSAFETKEGKMHCDALCRFLKVDVSIAVQATLGSLKDVSADTHLHTLLGTRSLFIKVLSFHHQQRIARLGVITELLRGNKKSEALDKVDHCLLLNGTPRGIFQKLVCSACAPESFENRDQVYPLKKLGDEFFVQQVLQAQLDQRFRERELSLEALLAYFYHGNFANYEELTILILALQSCGEFFSDFRSFPRLAQLAGLLCAEAINLSRIDQSRNFISSNVNLSLLTDMVLGFTEQVEIRRRKHALSGAVPAPESIAMLAIGLVLKATGSLKALECITIADGCGAFEFLQSCFNDLLPDSKQFSLGVHREIQVIDWDTTESQPVLSVEVQGPLSEISPNIVIYTSIGIELLSSVVTALYDFLESTENLYTLCNLGATLFANQPVFCSEFWSHPGSIGKLVEKASSRPIAAWILLSSLCFDRHSVGRVLSVFPKGHLRHTLANADINAAAILKAASKMAMYDPEALRNAFDDDAGVLFHIFSIYPTDELTLEQLLYLLSMTLRKSPTWAVTAANFFGARTSQDLLSRCLNSGRVTTVQHASRVVEALVGIMDVVCFTFSEKVVLEYLNVVVTSCLAASNALSKIFAFSNQPIISYSNAYIILNFLSTLITTLRTLSIHTLSPVRERAIEARIMILETFASSTFFGQALSFFASAPVSLSVGLIISDALEEEKLHDAATDDSEIEKNNAMKMWQRSIQKRNGSKATNFIKNRVDEMKNLNMTAVQNHGWSDDESAPIFASSAGIRLLNLWGIEAEHFSLNTAVSNVYLIHASPLRLLVSSATMPPSFRSDSKLVHLWSICSLRGYDLIINLINLPEINGLKLPCLGGISLLNMLAVHGKRCGDITASVFDTNGHLHSAMVSGISEGANELVDTSNRCNDLIGKGILLVKLLGSIFELDVQKGMRLLEHKGTLISSIMKVLIKSMSVGCCSKIHERFAMECLRVYFLGQKINDVLADTLGFFQNSDLKSLISSHLATYFMDVISTTILDSKQHDFFLYHKFGQPTFYEEMIAHFQEAIIRYHKAIMELSLITSSLKGNVSFGDPIETLEAFTNADSRIQFVGTKEYDVLYASRLLSSLNQDTPTLYVQEYFLAISSLKHFKSSIVSWVKLVDAGGTVDQKNISFWETMNLNGLLDRMLNISTLMCRVSEDVPAITSDVEDVIVAISKLTFMAVSQNTESSMSKAFDLSKLLAIMEKLLSRTNVSISLSSSLLNLFSTAIVMVNESLNVSDVQRLLAVLGGALAVHIPHDLMVTSLSLFSKILTSACLREKKGRDEVAMSLSVYKLVEILVNKVSLEAERSINEEKDFQIIKSILNVLVTLAEIDQENGSFLHLFRNSDLSRLFLYNPLIDREIHNWIVTGAEGAHYRGYVKSSSNSSKEIGIERVAVFLSGVCDPFHDIWMMIIRFLSTLLRLDSSHGRGRVFQHLANDFVSKYDEVIRSCFSINSGIGIESVLTKNSILEAFEIVNLLSELDSADSHIGSILLVVASFGRFLGSVGTGRFLFHLVRDLDSSHQEQDIPFENLQELHSALSGGLGNARFEAIRYAHYARNSYAMVTEDDYIRFSNDYGLVHPGSELEVTCSRSIINEFCISIENQVARCLVSALKFLLKVHPATRGFLLMSSEEKRLLNPFNIVSSGSLIAYHSETGTQYARVIGTDILRQSWTCKAVNPSTREEFAEINVHVENLAGIEDSQKQRTLFRFLAGPESATQLETRDYCDSASLGHLILILQWCRQNGKGVDQDTRSLLATNAASILSNEIAIYRETGPKNSKEGQTEKCLNDQLYDLFDVNSRFKDLCSCMKSDSIDFLRSKLRSNLESASIERAKQQQLLEERLSAKNGSIFQRDF
jgi:hypothetical protein